MSIEKKLICLSLNSKWEPIGYKSVKQAIIDLAGSEKNESSAHAINFEYELDSNGEPIYEYPKLVQPVAWKEWCELPIRPWDLVIHTPKKEIRVPTVIIALNYSEMPQKVVRGKPKKKILFMRDGGICAYTNKPIKYEDCNIDHVIPKGRGGADTYDNTVITSKKINNRKGNRLNEEVGLKLYIKPTIPKPILAKDTITELRHIDWAFFVKRK